MLQEHAGLRVLFFLSSVNKSLSMNAAKRPFSDVEVLPVLVPIGA